MGWMAPGRRDFSLLRLALGHTQTPLQWVPGAVSPGREAGYSPPSLTLWIGNFKLILILAHNLEHTINFYWKCVLFWVLSVLLTIPAVSSNLPYILEFKNTYRHHNYKIAKYHGVCDLMKDVFSAYSICGYCNRTNGFIW
jgi:hypothetical protein